MRRSSGIAALVGVLLVMSGIAAWEWYAHVRARDAAPQPVQQLAAATPAAAMPSPGATAAPTVEPPAAQPSASPSATAAPTPVTYVPETQPSATPGPAATPYASSGEPVVTEAPMVAATLAPHVVNVRPIREPPNAPPQILTMSLSTPVAHSGEVVSGTVQTSSNVASVEARIAGYSSSMRKVGVGKFVMSYRVPNLPFFLHRTYTIEVIARNTRGDAVRSSVPITIR